MYGSKLLTVISEKLSVHVSVSCTISLDLKIFLNSSVCSLFVLQEINLGNLKVKRHLLQNFLMTSVCIYYMTMLFIVTMFPKLLSCSRFPLVCDVLCIELWLLIDTIYSSCKGGNARGINLEFERLSPRIIERDDLSISDTGTLSVTLVCCASIWALDFGVSTGLSNSVSISVLWLDDHAYFTVCLCGTCFN